MSELTFKTDEEYLAAREKFFETHPEAPKAKEIECLNLIMRKEFAEEILRGKKPLEYRDFSEFYAKRLIDKDVTQYINDHLDDDEVLAFCNDVRQVKVIHFHNYNNSWYLDVECTYNDVFSITKGDIKSLQEEYGVHDFDEELENYEKNNIEERPFLFYFAIGKVLGTDLKV